jgi:succinate dehydrogenase hydrophobic anchor subunit
LLLEAKWAPASGFCLLTTYANYESFIAVTANEFCMQNTTFLVLASLILHRFLSLRCVWKGESILFCDVNERTDITKQSLSSHFIKIVIEVDVCT